MTKYHLTEEIEGLWVHITATSGKKYSFHLGAVVPGTMLANMIDEVLAEQEVEKNVKSV
jgi:hypothetical protein